MHDQLSKILNNYGRLPEVDAEQEPILVGWLKAYERQQEPQAVNRENLKDYRALQDDYYKIVDVTSELIDCVSLLVVSGWSKLLGLARSILVGSASLTRTADSHFQSSHGVHSRRRKENAKMSTGCS